MDEEHPARRSPFRLAAAASLALVALNIALAVWLYGAVSFAWFTTVLVSVILLEAVALILVLRRRKNDPMTAGELVDAVETALDLELRHPEPPPKQRPRGKSTLPRFASSQPQSDNERFFGTRKDQQGNPSAWDLL